MKIALVHANDGTDVRVGKVCRSLRRMGFDVCFIGWDRRPGSLKATDLGGAAVHLLSLATSHGRVTASGQARFIGHIIRTLFRIRPDVVCAVNEELAFALIPFKGLLFKRLVCDIFDALGPRTAHYPIPTRLVFRMAGEIGRWGADRLIATDDTRREMLGRYSSKATVVENFPEDPGDVLALTLPSGPVKIWAAGSLDAVHGLQELLDAVAPLENVRIVSAGWPYDTFASERFVNHEKVDFLGILTARQALQAAAQCDAVFCYYAPIHEYMINASPNKVFDAMAVGRPVIINEEVRLAAWATAEGIGVTVPYRDVTALRKVIENLANARGDLRDRALRARVLFKARYNWTMMEGTLRELYNGLSQ
jgi:glycosyltransferase involved in cell wall biosynthesis